MKALRLIIHQSSANYKKEETIDNKMTYPLPPISTIIGTLHSSCGYREYKEMDISIQGKYESMHREPYTDCCFLNSLQDDRGILVKMKNENILSNVFEKVATAKKSQGSSFRKEKAIYVHNQELLDEYKKLKNLKDEIDKFKKERYDPIMELINRRKKQLLEKQKKFDKKSGEYERVIKREKEIKKLEREIKSRWKAYQNENYTIPIGKFRNLVKSIKFYEILDGITLVLHVRAAESVLEDMLDHIYDLKSIGRSEDIVSVENAEIIELREEIEDDEIVSKFAAYIDCDMVNKERIYLRERKGKISGTKYYLNKKYEIVNGKRIFEKKKVLYVSQYAADEFGDGLYLDQYGEETYIVNFL